MLSWKTVLRRWHADIGRDGLTVHALATICNRSPAKILSEMQKAALRFDRNDEILLGFTCTTIRAPVFRLSDFESNAQTEGALESAAELLKKYPWPKYKSIRNSSGQLTLTDISKAELRYLRTGKPTGIPCGCGVSGCTRLVPFE